MSWLITKSTVLSSLKWELEKVTVVPLMGPARIIVFMTNEVRAPWLCYRWMKLSLSLVRDVPVVTAVMYFGAQCCCFYTNLPNWVHCPLFIQAKPKRLPQGLGGISLGTQSDFP